MLRRVSLGCATALALLSSLGARAAALVPGDVVVADPEAVAVIAIDPTSGSRTVIGSAGHLVYPTGVAVDPVSGVVYVADSQAGPGGTGAVYRLVPEAYEAANPAANQQLVAEGNHLVESFDLALEPTGTLVVADGDVGVVRVDPTSGVQQVLAALPAVVGIGVGPGGILYAAHPGPNQLWQVDPDDGAAQLASAGNLFNTPQDVAVLQDEDLAVTNFVNSRVVRVDPDVFDSGNPGGNQALLSEGVNLVTPRGVEVASDGFLLVADDGAAAGQGAVYRIDPATGTQTLLSSGPPMAGPVGIAVMRALARPGDIVVADQGPARRVVRVDPDTGEQAVVTTIAPGFPKDAYFDEDGALLVLVGGGGAPGRVLRIDPVTGSQRVLSTGLLFNLPERIVRDGSLWVADSAVFVFDGMNFTQGAIIEVLQSGLQLIFTGGGDKFRALSIDVFSDGDFLVGVTNSSFSSFDLVRVDRGSRLRTVLETDGNLDTPRDLVLASDALAYVAADTAGASNGGAVVTYDVAGDQQSVLAEYPAVVEPKGVGLDGQGRLIVAHEPSNNVGELAYVDRTTGAVTPISTGGLLQSPAGFAVLAPEPGARCASAAALSVVAALARWRVRRRG